jgi:hypothetical protein
MGCNCGKKKNDQPQVRQYYIPPTDTEPGKVVESVEAPVINVPQTPEQQLSQELNNWNGGPQNENNG